MTKIDVPIPTNAKDVTVMIKDTEIVAARQFVNEPSTLVEDGRIAGRLYQFADGGCVVVYWTEPE